MKRGVVAIVLFAVATAGCSDEERVVVAAGTTLVDSGFIERVLDEYPATGQVSVVAASSREALALGSAGSAQLLITHLPEAEEEFLAEHPDAVQEQIFTSQFVIVGPEDGPLVQRPNGSAVESFRAISEAEHLFVSRGDGSGTAAKEEELWDLAGIEPEGEPWYIETGQGMGFTLLVADQRDAYTLTEVGTFVAADAVTLIPFVSAAEDELLFNPYRITLPERASESARALFGWLASEDGTAALTAANSELFEGLLYIPCGMPDIIPAWSCQ